MEQFDTLPIQYRHIEHMHEGVWLKKNFFWQNDSYENLDNIWQNDRQFFSSMSFVYAWIVPSWADEFLQQLLMEQFITLLIQCRHIEHMHEGVWFRKNNYWQNDSCENLDNFFLLCIDGAFMGRSTPTTAFDGTIWYFAYTIKTHWTYAWRSLVEKKNLFDKMTAMRT